MRDDCAGQDPRGVAGAVNRRDAFRWLALAWAGLHAGDLSAQSRAVPAAPAEAPPRGQPGPVRFLDAAALRRAIREAPEETPGQPGLYSLRLSDSPAPVVLGIRRSAATRAEVHAGFADVWYVLEGTATLVTGGALVDGAESAPGEIRGRGIAGGEAKRVRAGDFIVVPAGVPHWVSGVETRELVYLVVKVPASR